MMRKPLEGVKVVELSTFVAAPACGRLLADWGADVIKVETSKGDAWRTFGRTHHVTATEEENPMFDIINSGKKSVVIDLKNEEGRKILFQILGDTDVFLTNTRAQSLLKLQLDYESIRKRFPRLIYATVTGFGDVGPEINNPGFDVVAYWGNSGFLNDLSIDTGTNYPVLAPTGVGDTTCGTSLFGAICAALYNRDRTGNGDYVTVSLLGAAVWTMGFMYIRAQDRYGDPFPKSRQSSPPMTAPYRCKDGEWLMISILEYERYFATLCNALGIPEVAGDVRFASRSESDKHRKELFEILEAKFITEDCAYWCELLTNNDIVCNRLSHFKDIVDNQQAWLNNYITRQNFPDGGSCVMPLPSLKSPSLGISEFTPAPILGANTKVVLAQHGFNEQDINKLEEEGVIGIR